MKRIYEFRCAQQHVSEHYIDESIRTTSCKECGEEAIVRAVLKTHKLTQLHMR